MDVARKIESLYPEVMGSNVMSVEDFLDNVLLLLDKDIQERVNKASLNGNVLHYVFVIEKSRCEVGIQELPKDSPLGRLRGSDNVVSIVFFLLTVYLMFPIVYLDLKGFLLYIFLEVKMYKSCA